MDKQQFRVNRHRGRSVAIATFAAIGATAGASAASTGVSAEATDVYCDANGNNCSSIVCIAEADGYRNGLLNASGTIFTSGVRYTNKSVYDTDFIDPDISNGDFGNDTFNFDENGNGTAYVCLHGTCNTETTTEAISTTRAGS